jgi:hypothetical protein
MAIGGVNERGLSDWLMQNEGWYLVLLPMPELRHLRLADLSALHRRIAEVEKLQTIRDERQRLMQDMHDGLGSPLISAIRSVESGGERRQGLAGTQELHGRPEADHRLAGAARRRPAAVAAHHGALQARASPGGTGIALSWEVRELSALD